jgi:hypothetical protein
MNFYYRPPLECLFEDEIWLSSFLEKILIGRVGRGWGVTGMVGNCDNGLEV